MKGCLKFVGIILALVGLGVVLFVGHAAYKALYAYPGMCELPGYHCTIVFPDGEVLIIEGGEQPSAVVIPAGEDRPRATATSVPLGVQATVVAPTPSPTSTTPHGGSGSGSCAYRLPDGSLPPGCGYGD